LVLIKKRAKIYRTPDLISGHLQIKAFMSQTQNIKLPKFTIEYDNFPNSVFKGSGMTYPFDGNMADFAWINRDGDLYLN